VNQALVLQLVRIGFLVLLWAFILAAVRVIRADLLGPTRRQIRRAAPPRPAPPAAQVAQGGRRNRPPQRLVVIEGALAGTTVRLSGVPVTIGRANDSTLVLTDDFASAHHARLTPRPDGQWLLEDMGSTNGTYLDRSRLTRPVQVPVGVPVRIGKTVLELRR
jgi:pSer/pThr/pTyr-binding forkhead associated (FHA) protein